MLTVTVANARSLFNVSVSDRDHRCRTGRLNTGSAPDQPCACTCPVQRTTRSQGSGCTPHSPCERCRGSVNRWNIMVVNEMLKTPDARTLWISSDVRPHRPDGIAVATHRAVGDRE